MSNSFTMSAITAIHQFHPSCAVGDGVTKSLFFIRRLLRGLGLTSDIYCEQIPAALKHEVKPLSSLPQGEEYLLLHHHSLGYRNADWLDRLAAPRVLVYHNITPPDLLPPGELPELSRLGRRQLADWATRCVGAIGVSEFNSTELREAGYRQVITLPLLVDLDLWSQADWDRDALVPLRDRLNVLFVGRISENKRQHELLEVFFELEHFLGQPARLILAGGITSSPYHERLKARVAAHGAEDRVWLTGKVSDDELQAFYRAADLFVCLSEHEGFCMPVLEAMLHDVPVVAREAGALAATLGEGGLLLEASVNDARRIAAVWHTVLSEPGLRQRMLAGQRRNLEAYQPERLWQQLADYLRMLGCATGAPPTQTARSSEPYWQVEGPIDSTYSLAIVNRELGVALAEKGLDVGLFRPTDGEGGSDDPHWLHHHAPAALPLADRALTAAKVGQLPDVTLRFNYPPWVDGIHGTTRVVHSYGWEESAFPEAYVAAFNRRLDGITTLSHQVKKVLRDSGVRLPMRVVGTGVDHVLREAPQAVELLPTTEAAGFRFLHVSSCFPRKGVDVLLAAWARAFRADDDVVLIIKCFPNPHNDVEEQVAEWRERDADFPAVEVINRDLSQAELTWLYRYCDALVAPSRGEGFGMPMAEAMLFELPVITTAWGGQTDFCTPETSWLCDYDFAWAGSHLGVPHSVWAEPRVDHLAECMRTVHEATPEQREARTRPARERVLRDFSWAAVADRTVAAVEALRATPMLRRAPKIAWISTWNTRCGIANYSKFLTQAIPANRLQVLAPEAGERVAPDEDFVLRCWREDIRDNPAAGLLAEVDERGLEAVVVQYNFGFFSLQGLAELLAGLAERAIPAYVFLHATADIDRDDLKVSLRSIAPQLALAERVVVHGVGDLNRLKEFGLVDNVLMFPHGVPDTPPLPPASVRQARGLAGKRVIASYGFLLPHKGVQTLIEAFARLAKHDASLHLLLVCALYPNPISAREKRDCDALIERLGLGKRVTFVSDFLPDAESLSWLQMADIIVFPYQYTQESSSAAVRGGLAAGRAVVVTPLSIFEDVADGVHHLPGVDVDDIANGLAELLADDAALTAVEERGVRWCDARRWPRVAVRLLDMIDGVANDAVS